jgi:hypothetical protein
MNCLLGIEQDKDVININTATEEEIFDFAEGAGIAPNLEPMRPFLENNKSNDWNDKLCELFTEHFEMENDFQLTPDERTTVEDMFLDRLQRLTKIWREFRKFDRSEMLVRERRLNERARRNTRRVDVSQA